MQASSALTASVGSPKTGEEYEAQYSPPVLGGTDAEVRAEPSSLELCRATRKSPKAMAESRGG